MQTTYLRVALMVMLPVFAQVVIPRAVLAQPSIKVIDVRIEQRKVVQPQNAVRLVKGDAVTLRWQTDEKVTLHMHGYDLKLDVEPGRLAEMHFDAAVSGRFPVTSHGFGSGHGHGHAALLYVEVYPE